MLMIVDNLGLTPEQRSKVNTIIAAIKCHIDGHITQSMEHHKLPRHSQQSGESFDDFWWPYKSLQRLVTFGQKMAPQKTLGTRLLKTSMMATQSTAESHLGHSNHYMSNPGSC